MTGTVYGIVAMAFTATGLIIAAIIGRAGRAAWQAYEQQFPWPLESDGFERECAEFGCHPPEWVNDGKASVPDSDRWTHDLPGRSS
jgi:hypothetical protein